MSYTNWIVHFSYLLLKTSGILRYRIKASKVFFFFFFSFNPHISVLRKPKYFKNSPHMLAFFQLPKILLLHFCKIRACRGCWGVALAFKHSGMLFNMLSLWTTWTVDDKQYNQLLKPTHLLCYFVWQHIACVQGVLHSSRIIPKRA